MKYSNLAFYTGEYDKAFEANRQENLRDNFDLYVFIIIGLVIIWFVIKALKKKGKIPQKLIATGVGKLIDLGKNAAISIVDKTKKGGKGK